MSAQANFDDWNELVQAVGGTGYLLTTPNTTTDRYSVVMASYLARLSFFPSLSLGGTEETEESKWDSMRTTPHIRTVNSERDFSNRAWSSQAVRFNYKTSAPPDSTLLRMRKHCQCGFCI